MTAIDPQHAWVLQQVDQDELDAKNMAIVYPTPWEVSDRGWMVHITAEAPDFREVLRLEQWPDQPDDWLTGFVRHVDNWNPDRVLAECAARRRLLRRHEPVVIHERDGIVACRCCGYGSQWPIRWPCDTFRDVASVYTDRPGCPDEWRS